MFRKYQALWVAGLLISFVLVGLWWIGQTVHSVSQETSKSALNLEARRLLYQMAVRLKENQQRTGSYIGSIGDSPMKTPRYGAGTKLEGTQVWWGQADYSVLLEKLCPDCGVTKDHFKLIAVGNIDQDTELDVWVQDSENFNAKHLFSD